MPLYEYQCARCGKRLEKIQLLRDAPLAECPSCGGSLERLISAPAIQFKGTGWYVTDYAHKSGAPAAGNGGGKEQPAPAATEKSGGDKSAGGDKSSSPAPAAATPASKAD